jgi:hypothetical protein
LPENSDEAKMNKFFDFPALTIEIITAAAGIAVLAFIVFRIIKPAQRMTFVFSGITGGVTGYYTWLKWLGPLMMP